MLVVNVDVAERHSSLAPQLHRVANEQWQLSQSVLHTSRHADTDNYSAIKVRSYVPFRNNVAYANGKRTVKMQLHFV